MEENNIILELPLPISVNEAYAGYRIRHKSTKYKAWIALAEFELRKQTKYKITGDNRLEVHCNFFTPLYYKNGKKKRHDLDNFLKPLFDFLGDNIEGFKDEYIKEIIAKKIDSPDKKVKILIKEITNG